MNSICKTCDLKRVDNEVEILIRMLRREVEELSKTTTARLLLQDSKISETCVYIKNNLSNSIRELLDSMLVNGELDKIITDSLINEVELIREANSNIISLSMYGVKGDGCSDDTLAIQQAIDKAPEGSIIRFNKGTYLHDTIVISKNNVVIDGSNSKHILKNNDSACFELKTSKNVVIENFTIIGNGKDDTLQKGIYSDSGNSFDNITIKNNYIEGVTLGISVNSDLAGHINKVDIYNNYLKDIKGEGVGLGYGIHIANGSDEFSNSSIYNNLIDNAERHSIYVARGRGYTVKDNTIKNHRYKVSDDSLRPAMNVSRSSYVTILNNKFENCYDGNLCVMGEENSKNYPLRSYPAMNITISKNIFVGPVNLSAIFIGYLDISDGLPTNILIESNSFKDIQPLRLAYGKNITYINNISSHNDFHVIADSMSEDCNLYNISNYLYLFYIHIYQL